MLIKILRVVPKKWYKFGKKRKSGVIVDINGKYYFLKPGDQIAFEQGKKAGKNNKK